MSTRVVKAWACHVAGYDNAEPDIVHATSAGRARAELIRRLEISEITFTDVTARRAAAHDIVLPERHRLAAELDARDRDILLNAHGCASHIRPHQWGYRDHYCTAPGDTRLHRLAWELGLFHGPYGEDRDGTSPGWAGVFYYVSDFGKHVAKSLIEVR